MTPDDEGKEEEYYVSSTPVFQEVLFKFLDTEAPTLTGPGQSSKQKQEVKYIFFLHILMKCNINLHEKLGIRDQDSNKP